MADRSEIEQQLRGLCERGDHTEAATFAIKSYGPEILGFLIGTLRRGQDANEVFSGFAERLWRGLPRFGWESSLRTWAYTIARNAARTHDASARRRARVESPLPTGSSLSGIPEAVRTATRSFLKTPMKSRIEQLRASLPPEDRMLLALRIDRELAFHDIARVMHDGDAAPDDQQLAREVARLRKRFQLLKDKLVALGKREGIIRERRSGPR